MKTTQQPRTEPHPFTVKDMKICRTSSILTCTPHQRVETDEQKLKHVKFHCRPPLVRRTYNIRLILIERCKWIVCYLWKFQQLIPQSWNLLIIQ